MTYGHDFFQFEFELVAKIYICQCILIDNGIFTTFIAIGVFAIILGILESFLDAFVEYYDVRA